VNDAEPSLGARLAAVRASVEDAAATAGRPVDDITTIVVTKFHPASLIRELHELGVTDFGESRHQEARQKAAELAGLEATWHFVGQLQGKKARQVAAYADIIHSVDRESLVAALGASAGSAGGPAVGCLLQVNRTEDPDRGGAPPGRLLPLAELALGAGGLRLLGVMAIAPLGEEPRRAFARLREASERLRTVAPDAAAISAGMSGDFREAILEGATHLRIGTAITGIRPSAG
jgi:pyridoxal phosphate enzyme (YggS family)